MQVIQNRKENFFAEDKEIPPDAENNMVVVYFMLAKFTTSLRFVPVEFDNYLANYYLWS